MLVGVDAKALEWKTLIEMSRDVVGLEEIFSGEDMHTNNQHHFGLPSRLIAKKYLFRTIYNRGKGYAFTVDPDFMGVSTSVSYWDDIGEKFYKKYKGIDKLHHKWKDDLFENDTITSDIFGCEWTCDKFTKYGDINWNTLTNYPNQGTGAHVMTIARVSFWNRVKKAKLQEYVKPIQTVHDSIMCDVLDECVQWTVNTYHEVFRDIPANIKKLFGYEWIVPLQCETYGGKNQKEVVDLFPN